MIAKKGKDITIKNNVLNKSAREFLKVYLYITNKFKRTKKEKRINFIIEFSISIKKLKLVTLLIKKK